MNFKKGEYIIYKNNGLGIITDINPTIFKEQETILVDVKILYQVNHNNILIKNKNPESNCSFPIHDNILSKIREPIKTKEIIKYMMNDIQTINTMALLEDDFKIDLFNLEEGIDKLIILYDYLYHALVNKQKICSNYFVMYEHAIKHLSMEIFQTEFIKTNNIIEGILFYNHLIRNCKRCSKNESYLKNKKSIEQIENQINEYINNINKSESIFSILEKEYNG